jgi:hypothetical protein
MTTTHVTIRVKQVPEGAFLATSDETAEFDTRDEIIATTPEIALELLEMTWRELRRLLVDHGCKYLRDARV